jgi:hypothetical protein
MAWHCKALRATDAKLLAVALARMEGRKPMKFTEHTIDSVKPVFTLVVAIIQLILLFVFFTMLGDIRRHLDAIRAVLQAERGTPAQSADR